MPIIDKFKDMGTTVMGKVESGSLREGDSLVIMPNKVIYLPSTHPTYILVLMNLCFSFGIDDIHIYLQANVKVVAIFCDEDKVSYAGPGENLRVRVSGIEEEDILAGFVLSSIGRFSFLPSVLYCCENFGVYVCYLNLVPIFFELIVTNVLKITRCS